MPNRRLLFFCAEEYPPIYPFLDVVFNTHLKALGTVTTWIMPSRSCEALEETTWNGARTYLIPKPRGGNAATLVPLYWHHLRCIWAAADRALQPGEKVDILQVRDDPAMAYVAWRLARRIGVPWVYQISHLKEEERILYARMGIYGSRLANTVQGRVGRLLRNALLRRADLVFPISDQMAKTLSSARLPHERVVAIPEGIHSADFDAIDARERQEVRRRLGLEGKLVMVYAGTMSRFRRLDFLLRVLARLAERQPLAHLLMVGAGNDPADLGWLQSLTRRMGLGSRVSFVGWVPRAEATAYIAASDVGLSPIPPNPVLENSSPIKLLEYLAAGVPVVGTDIPDQRVVIQESGGGLCVPWEEGRFARSVEELFSSSPEERKRMGAKGKEYASTRRDFRVLADRVLTAYSRLVPDSQDPGSMSELRDS